MTIASRYAAVQKRVQESLARAGRPSDDLVIVAVAKTFPIPIILEALDAGVTDIGENRPQELKEKAIAIGPRARWHLVGPLQTNKVRSVVGVVELIHSVDRYGLGEAIARRARAVGIVQSVLVEVNLAQEASKHGVPPTQAIALAEDLSRLEGLEVRGLMSIPPRRSNPDDTRGDFRGLAALCREMRAHVSGATELSMGMSRDFDIAIEEGSTIVRVGEAIFGARSR
ncbi:MAG: YggS family pyridoxal phosphate-dependent enzyme [Actinomycetota bacterium]